MNKRVLPSLCIWLSTPSLVSVMRPRRHLLTTVCKLFLLSPQDIWAPRACPSRPCAQDFLSHCTAVRWASYAHFTEEETKPVEKEPARGHTQAQIASPLYSQALSTLPHGVSHKKQLNNNKTHCGALSVILDGLQLAPP